MAVKWKKKPAGETMHTHSAPSATDYSQHLKGAEGHAHITTTLKAKGQVTHEDNATEKVAAVMLNAADVAVVTVGGKQTLNLGNYESATISVQVSLPCGKKEIDEVYEFATDWVSERITKAVSEAKS